MTRTEITYLVVGVAGVLSLATWIGLIVVPAWRSYSRVWERLVAVLASVYVLAALLGAGALVGAIVLYYYGDLQLPT